MEVNFKEINNNSMFYEVVLNGEVLFTGIPRDIMKEFKFTDSDWNKLHSRKQSIDGLTVRPYGRMNLLFKYDGFIGTREEIIEEFDIKPYLIQRGRILLKKVGYFFDCDADNRVIIEEKKEVPAIKIEKKKIESPNQKYIDSLFSNCFKGWRA